MTDSRSRSPCQTRPFIFWTKLSSDAAATAVRAMTGKGVHFRSELKLWLAFRKLEIRYGKEKCHKSSSAVVKLVSVATYSFINRSKPVRFSEV